MQNKKKAVAVFVHALMIITLMTSSVQAQTPILREKTALNNDSSSDLFAPETPPTLALSSANNDLTSQEDCAYEVPNEIKYDALFISSRSKLRIDAGESVRIKAFIKNTSNVPWFSNESSCAGPRVNLGTENPRDAASLFYSPTVPEVENSGWITSNRIAMDQLRVDPEQIASFTFWIQAGTEPDIIKQYLAPVVEGEKWLDKGKFSFNLMIGETDVPPNEAHQRLIYSPESGSVKDLEIYGDKSIHVDISEQKLEMKIGDFTVQTFQVSTGKRATPTPVGEFKILSKQEVRIGKAKPHYIMPKFMMFKSGGYGFHALPSLARDGGIYWREALSHIGVPVSHGCIRLLPEEADALYTFAEIGTKVHIKY